MNRAYLLPLALAGALVVRLGWSVAARVPYPFDLEWMEGGMLAHAWRLQHGRALYPAPSAEWIPFVYPPGYAAVLAALGSVFGLSPPLGRLVSVAGTALAALGIGHAVTRVVRDPLPGVLAAVCYLGTWPQGGAFFDLVRTESLGVGLLALAVAAALDGRRGTPVASGLALAAAFVVKQNHAVFGLPLLYLFAARDGRAAALRFLAASAGPALAVTALWSWRSEGRFLTYVLAVPASHGLKGPRGFPGTPWELGQALPALLLGGAAALVLRVRGFAGRVVVGSGGVAAALLAHERGAAFPFGLPPVEGVPASGAVASAVGVAALAVGALGGPWRKVGPAGRALWSLTALAIGGAALMRAHHGGFVNVHMPMFAVVTIASTVAVVSVARRWAGAQADVWISALFAAQLGWAHARFDDDLVPTEADARVGAQVVARIAAVDGPVLSPYAPWLPVYAGKEPSWHLISLWDLAHHPRTPLPGVGDQVEAAMRDHQWAAVLDAPRSLQFGVRASYPRAERLPGSAQVLLPKTGWKTRPTLLLRPPLK